jgi:antitoxin HigA-1
MGPFVSRGTIDGYLSGRELASKLDVSASTLNRILKGSSGISPETALRLSKALGRSPENWLATQYNRDLRQARQYVKLLVKFGLRRPNPSPVPMPDPPVRLSLLSYITLSTNLLFYFHISQLD